MDYLDKKNINIKYLDIDIIYTYLSDSKNLRTLSQNPYSKLVVIIRSFLSFLHRREMIKKDLIAEIKVPKKVNKENTVVKANIATLPSKYKNFLFVLAKNPSQFSAISTGRRPKIEISYGVQILLTLNSNVCDFEHHAEGLFKGINERSSAVVKL